MSTSRSYLHDLGRLDDLFLQIGRLKVAFCLKSHTSDYKITYEDVLSSYLNKDDDILLQHGGIKQKMRRVSL